MLAGELDLVEEGDERLDDAGLAGGAVAAQGSPEEIITPELLEEVFGLKALVVADPVTGGPLVVPA